MLPANSFTAGEISESSTELEGLPVPRKVKHYVALCCTAFIKPKATPFGSLYLIYNFLLKQHRDAASKRKHVMGKPVVHSN